MRRRRALKEFKKKKEGLDTGERREDLLHPKNRSSRRTECVRAAAERQKENEDRLYVLGGVENQTLSHLSGRVRKLPKSETTKIEEPKEDLSRPLLSKESLAEGTVGSSRK